MHRERRTSPSVDAGGDAFAALDPTDAVDDDDDDDDGEDDEDP
jgi:hypothetical protein